MKSQRPNISVQSYSQRGYILLPVVFTLALLASIAYIINRSASTDLSIDSSKFDAIQMQYAADAAMQAAIWRVNNGGCSVPSDMANESILGHAFNVSFTGSSPDISIDIDSADAKVQLHRSASVIQYDHSAPQTNTIVADSGNFSFVYIESDKQNHNHNTEDTFQVNSNENKMARSLIKFDLSPIPTTAQIETATLGLYTTSSAGASDVVKIHRVTQSWTEDKANWTESNQDQTWAVEGGDYDRAIEASFEVSTTGNITIDIGPLVQTWLTTMNVSNYGMLLLGDEQPGDHKKKFASSFESNTDQRPSLTVGYYCQCGENCVALAPI